MVWILNVLFLKLKSCMVLVSYENEVYTFVHPLLFVTEWHHWFLNSIGFTINEPKTYAILHETLNLRFRNSKPIFLAIYFLLIVSLFLKLCLLFWVDIYILDVLLDSNILSFIIWSISSLHLEPLTWHSEDRIIFTSI